MYNAEADGKDAMRETIRKKDAMKRRQYSSKVSTDAVRLINWSTGTRFPFEHTRAYGGRIE